VIVVDASAMAELLLRTALGLRVEERLFRDDDELHAPHLIDVEVAQALRRLVRAGEVADARAGTAIGDLADFRLRRHPHVLCLSRAWELRNNLTMYDGMYVVLAEALDATVVTCDGALGGSPGHSARIEVIR
jgi:predicted nucleic acid-binding protein